MNNREIDALVAEKVMGFTLKDNRVVVRRRLSDGSYTTWLDLPHYSTDMAAAWQVLDKISRDYPEISIAKSDHTVNRGFWEVCLEKKCDDRNETRIIFEAETPSMAICQAALKAVMDKPPG